MPPALLPEGLTWRGGAIHIDTTVGGRRISRSCRTTLLPEARHLLETVRGQIRVAILTGIVPHVFQPRVDFAEFVARALAAMRLDGAARKTLAKYTGIMRFFGDYLRRRLATRTPADRPYQHDGDSRQEQVPLFKTCSAGCCEQPAPPARLVQLRDRR
jgi:hypothetical protein